MNHTQNGTNLTTSNRKKTNGNMCADWGATVDGVDAIDIGTKKSIWQKMQRKRVNTVLRPSHHSIVKNLVKATKSSTVDCFDMGNGDGTVNPSVKAEELLLLALHPEAPGSFSSTPDNEPGWHICLDTPQHRNPHSILHTDQVGIVSQSFLSVCCSTGRQSASFLERHHLRTLNDETPLSFVTKASALAETNPTCRTKATQGKTIEMRNSFLLISFVMLTSFCFIKILLMPILSQNRMSSGSSDSVS